LGFRIRVGGSGFWVKGLVFWVEGLGAWVCGFKFRFKV
jgi:hypothetical protein